MTTCTSFPRNQVKLAAGTSDKLPNTVSDQCTLATTGDTRWRTITKRQLSRRLRNTMGINIPYSDAIICDLRD